MTREVDPQHANLGKAEIQRPSSGGFIAAGGMAVGAGVFALLMSSGGGGAGGGHESAPSHGTTVEHTQVPSPAATKTIGQAICSNRSGDTNFQNISPSEARNLMNAGSLPNFQRLWAQASGQEAPCAGDASNIVYSLDLQGDNADLAQQLATAISDYYGSVMIEDFGTSNTIRKDNISVDIQSY